MIQLIEKTKFCDDPIEKNKFLNDPIEKR